MHSGYSLELPSEYPQYKFSWENKKKYLYEHCAMFAMKAMAQPVYAFMQSDLGHYCSHTAPDKEHFSTKMY